MAESVIGVGIVSTVGGRVKCSSHLNNCNVNNFFGYSDSGSFKNRVVPIFSNILYGGGTYALKDYKIGVLLVIGTEEETVTYGDVSLKENAEVYFLVNVAIVEAMLKQSGSLKPLVEMYRKRSKSTLDDNDIMNNLVDVFMNKYTATITDTKAALLYQNYTVEYDLGSCQLLVNGRNIDVNI